MQLLTGLIVITAYAQSLSASDICSEELARLQEQEKLLKSQLQKQELLLHRLQLLNQPGNKNKAKPDQTQDSQYADCSQLFTSGFKSSGFYKIKTMSVYCDMSEGGGWTVIQRRINGTETFNRSWAEYKDGFGDMNAELGEFWLGNDNLHHITAQGNYSLRINLEDFDGNQRYAEYKNFKVTDEKDHYRLTFGDYVGTAGDALSGGHQVASDAFFDIEGKRQCSVVTAQFFLTIGDGGCCSIHTICLLPGRLSAPVAHSKASPGGPMLGAWKT
ncbi:fibrinogen-like protein 1 [Lates japonicus]|uniref:Fibrinogen-like protein 1 n=1 Tax=Lates japonicus TaxID=270547 RepID=A0AAD3MZG1_LATJO|nr:fibrinogen-like protein 1 [Lates japonicus]